jgi:hypothetical protein
VLKRRLGDNFFIYGKVLAFELMNFRLVITYPFVPLIDNTSLYEPKKCRKKRCSY